MQGQLEADLPIDNHRGLGILHLESFKSSSPMMAMEQMEIPRKSVGGI